MVLGCARTVSNPYRYDKSYNELKAQKEAGMFQILIGTIKARGSG